MRLKNKVIIVTGSTTGIGKAIAIRCVAEGARVVVHGLEDDLGNEVMSAIGNENGVLHISDLSEEGAVKKLTDLALKSFGKLDAVVNNAAWVVSSDIKSTDLAFLRKVLEVNTIAPLALIQSALPLLQKTGGCVLNIGSVNAWSGEPNLLAYSVSKGALTTLTRNLGDTLFREYGVRVNQINPGWVLTEKEIQRKNDQGLREDWYRDIPGVFAPAGRLLSPAEIAAAALYWLSDESGPVSGQVVDIEQYPMIGRNPPKH
ncbi:MAG: SDR family oxidoreductase [Bacteroidota bacterium]|nr:SDR family oxidoreductase [Bacteroidota bacterium]